MNVIPTSHEDDKQERPTPNLALLNALAEVEKIQKGMQPKEDKDTQNYLREARSGAMYGYSETE